VKSIARMSMAELVGHVQSHLHAAGIQTALSGGSCVTYWSENAYQSDGIDLIPEGIGQRALIRATMLGLGFSEHNRYFTHPDTKLFVEFPAGPLAVGEERPRQIDEIVTATGIMRLLSPTDCVKDRLTWWFHNGDRQCLEQAIAVAQTAGVDMDEIRRWSRGEGKASEFTAIAAQLSRKRGAKRTRRRT
jgi:hypothetical protein